MYDPGSTPCLRGSSYLIHKDRCPTLRITLLLEQVPATLGRTANGLPKGLRALMLTANTCCTRAKTIASERIRSLTGSEDAFDMTPISSTAKRADQAKTTPELPIHRSCSCNSRERWQHIFCSTRSKTLAICRWSIIQDQHNPRHASLMIQGTKMLRKLLALR